MLQKLKNYYRDPLYKNSLYIMLNSVTGALFGFIFWMIAARYYSSWDVGLATALISSAGIIVNLSSFGLNTGIIRFLPGSTEKTQLFSSIWIVSIAGALIFGFIFLIGIDIFSPQMKFLMNPLVIVIFILLLIFQMSSGLFNNALLALRKAEYSFAQNMGLGLRIILLIPLTFAGVLGIFGSLGIAFFASFGIGLFLLYRMNILIKPVLKKNLLNDVFHFSLANYIADFLVMAESAILPILILNVIGAKEAAYFYVAFSIAGLLYAVPNALFISMFIEGSHGMPLRKNMIKALAAAGVIMIPVGIVIFFFGDILLNLFSREYSQNAYEILKLLVLSSFFVVFNALFICVERIRKNIKPIIVINAVLFAVTVIASYFFMQHYGVMGVGMGWIAGQGVSSIVAGGIAWIERRD
ncbi:MAG: lipopolysaccharide biosynthesis protein [Candidatus Methanoperedens sp.]|nr:lipopolysaccharide biosynthesis protein [Candidatus Methanoperedens sp.]